MRWLPTAPLTLSLVFIVFINNNNNTITGVIKPVRPSQSVPDTERPISFVERDRKKIKTGRILLYYGKLTDAVQNELRKFSSVHRAVSISEHLCVRYLASFLFTQQIKGT